MGCPTHTAFRSPTLERFLSRYVNPTPNPRWNSFVIQTASAVHYSIIMLLPQGGRVSNAAKLVRETKRSKYYCCIYVA